MAQKPLIPGVYKGVSSVVVAQLHTAIETLLGVTIDATEKAEQRWGDDTQTHLEHPTLGALGLAGIEIIAYLTPAMSDALNDELVANHGLVLADFPPPNELYHPVLGRVVTASGNAAEGSVTAGIYRKTHNPAAFPDGRELLTTAPLWSSVLTDIADLGGFTVVFEMPTDIAGYFNTFVPVPESGLAREFEADASHTATPYNELGLHAQVAETQFVYGGDPLVTLTPRIELPTETSTDPVPNVYHKAVNTRFSSWAKDQNFVDGLGEADLAAIFDVEDTDIIASIAKGSGRSVESVSEFSTAHRLTNLMNDSTVNWQGPVLALIKRLQIPVAEHMGFVGKSSDPIASTDPVSAVQQRLIYLEESEVAQVLTDAAGLGLLETVDSPEWMAEYQQTLGAMTTAFMGHTRQWRLNLPLGEGGDSLSDWLGETSFSGDATKLDEFVKVVISVERSGPEGHGTAPLEDALNNETSFSPTEIENGQNMFRTAFIAAEHLPAAQAIRGALTDTSYNKLFEAATWPKSMWQTILSGKVPPSFDAPSSPEALAKFAEEASQRVRDVFPGTVLSHHLSTRGDQVTNGLLKKPIKTAGIVDEENALDIFKKKELARTALAARFPEMERTVGAG